MKKAGRIAIRVGVSGLIGVTVSIIICLAAWQSLRGNYSAVPEQAFTRLWLKRTMAAIELYKERNGALPQSLEQLRTVPNGADLLDKNGAILDRWHRPLQYSVEGSEYLVLSFGRDGKPGGRGLDYDLSNKKLYPKEALLDLGEFVGRAKAARMIRICGIGGIVAFLLSVFLIKPSSPTRPELKGLVIRLALTVVATVALGVFISLSHLFPTH